MRGDRATRDAVDQMGGNLAERGSAEDLPGTYPMDVGGSEVTLGIDQDLPLPSISPWSET